MTGYEYVIIGGGILGISLARELKRREPQAKIALIDKEACFGFHASGRNSGILHAGFYYSKNSLKAKFCKEGNLALATYCRAKQIRVNVCGKLVVASAESELDGLNELYERGQTNGVILHKITAAEAKHIEPRVKTVDYALFSPTTASVNPNAVIAAMAQDAATEGIDIRLNTQYQARMQDGIQTSQGPIQAQFIINAAGLYADKIARDFGFSQNHRILPFKGLYLYSDEKPGSLKTHIYPVPDLRYPFLGVHCTLTNNGGYKIGPTAIPAFWREQYDGWSRFKLNELCDIVGRQLGLLASSTFDFKKLAFTELQKYLGSKMVSLTDRLIEGVDKRHFTTWGKPGMRAQLFNLRTKQLETDFLLEGDAHSLHILNAVSPGFTAAIPFSRHVIDTLLTCKGSSIDSSTGNEYSSANVL
jgi:L-2-hydroxyglutarate oxidase LhgO